MVLLPTSYRYGASYNFIIKLQFNKGAFGVYMVKHCHEKMLILRCILPSIN